jgi:hypothetical protein
VSKQLGISRVVLSSMELVSFIYICPTYVFPSVMAIISMCCLCFIVIVTQATQGDDSQSMGDLPTHTWEHYKKDNSHSNVQAARRDNGPSLMDTLAHALDSTRNETK